MPLDLKNILVIKLRSIGDVVLSTPFIKNLRHAFPQAKISCLVDDMIVPLLVYDTDIDEVIPFHRKAMKSSGILKKATSSLSFLRMLRAKRFDAVFDLHGNPRSALFTLSTGAPLRVGFDYRMRKFAYNHVVHGQNPQYACDFYLDLLRDLGIECPYRTPSLVISDVDTRWAGEKYDQLGIRTDDCVIGISPTGTWRTKVWPAASFSRIIDLIERSYPSLKIVVFWGPGERDLAQRVVADSAERAMMAPETDLGKLAALLSRVSILICSDNAMKHIAVSVGAKTVTIFGPTQYLCWNPPDLDRYPVVRSTTLDCLECDRMECSDLRCMTSISPEKVFSAFKDLYGRL